MTTTHDWLIRVETEVLGGDDFGFPDAIKLQEEVGRISGDNRPSGGLRQGFRAMEAEAIGVHVTFYVRADQEPDALTRAVDIVQEAAHGLGYSLDEMRAQPYTRDRD